ncbi:DUF4350 domain-containing protein [Arenibacter sp. TNZ]|jgi:hypothetical protein|uniref:DUF4350 domain-containing protein n=1 Tax=Arenibacter TaxID=178469 RepID=UPI000CD45A4D|nr:MULTISPECIES: DUF4350 domain-containing protein [Arenibacter]MCM4169938.1 DUF4350 domain-containing protein [Arenibacter sp. TNZ]
MDKRSKIILGIFIVVLMGIVVTEIVRPKPLNWKPSYTSSDKIPFGCYVLFKELPNLFPEQEIKSSNESLYNVLIDRDTSKTSNYLLINDFLDLDKQEAHQLLQYVHKGNDTFIAASSFGTILSDTLNIEVETQYSIKEDTVLLRLTNNTFSKKNYSLTRGIYNTHFTSFDTINTTILGYVSFSPETGLIDTSSKEKTVSPNFLRIKFGKGNFYLNTTPQTFTNYYMLKDNADYVANTLSYLKDKDLYWDNYKKSGRIVIDSPMRFVLNQESLRWAYYLSLTGLLIFIIFKAKREQRIIPVINPLENSSIEFAKTVGGLYYEHKDYTDLISKKINIFLEHIRSHYYLNTETINEKTATDLSAKSGKPLSEAQDIIDLIVHLKSKIHHNEQDVIALNKKLNQFKK